MNQAPWAEVMARELVAFGAEAAARPTEPAPGDAARIDARRWVIEDDTPVVDGPAQRHTRQTLHAPFGRSIESLRGAALNIFLRPGVGIGHDRPHDCTLEVGVCVVTM